MTPEHILLLIILLVIPIVIALLRYRPTIDQFNNSILTLTQSISRGRNFIDVSAGSSHTIIHGAMGRALVCGYNNNGRLGTGDTNTLIAPVDVFPPTTKIKKVIAGNTSSFFITHQNTVYATGDNKLFQLGFGANTTFTYVPKEIPYLTQNNINIVDVASGWNHTLFLADNGRVYSCGNNNVGQLGLNNVDPREIPIEIKYFTDNNIFIQRISANSTAHSVFLSKEGKVYTTGWNWFGQLATGNKTNYIQPTLVRYFENNNIKIINIFTGDVCTFFISDKHVVYVAGINVANRFGMSVPPPPPRHTTSPPPEELSLPTEVPFFTSNRLKVKHISVGSEHTIFLTYAGVVYVCGSNSVGQLGMNNYTDVTVPTIPPDFQIKNIKIATIAAGGYHSIFITQENLVLACGNNAVGQLGIGSSDIARVNAPTPCDIPIVDYNQMYNASFGANVETMSKKINI